MGFMGGWVLCGAEADGYLMKLPTQLADCPALLLHRTTFALGDVRKVHEILIGFLEMG